MKKLFNIIAITSSVLAGLLLSGCATDFTSKVTIKQTWPTDIADRSFAVEKNTDYGDSEEFIEASDLIKNRLQELGFTEVKENETSALKVEVYINSQLRNPYLTPFFGSPYGIGPYGGFGVYDPFYSFGYRSAFYPRRMIYPRFRSPMYSPFYMGRRIDPFFLQNTIDGEVFRHTIGITIKETSGKPLYMVSASSEHFGYEIYSHIPYLVQSALQEFPGNNGKYEVVIPLKK